MSNEPSVHTRCLFCENAQDSVLYPPRIDTSSITGYTFSARRQRKREHYRIVACRTCGLVRSDPVFAEGRLKELYSDSCFIFSDEAPYAAQTYIELLQDLRGRHCGQSHPGSLMEIGCSTGFFLQQALKMGISDVVGFEPSRNCFEHAEEDVRKRIINDVYRPELIGDKTFDLICSFHVFDHLPDPLAVLSSAMERLNRGGHVLIVCHDVESLGARLLRDFNPIFDIEHIYLFSQKTMAMLFERAGLTTLEVGPLRNTYPFGYWMRMMPAFNKLGHLLPEGLKNLPVSLKAGNLYAFARKDR